ncbi:fumarylacetoacetate hydrolase family protein [Thalassobacillus sp. CUG 92003]|uniref:fumarylacetoacetate hydrolase family protein n=1 Tax=Thalassobacillus sp. CUG 92003 TaxID=2736641 RepID=UPI0015E7BFCE|nr:fumarylacetoacetate hydrolase family protein [Thalassobacillus sp. CUG 92003]
MPVVRAHRSGRLQADFFEVEEIKLLHNKDVWNPPVTGAVYGTLLNYQGTLDQMGADLDEPPYQSPPKAPILYMKPVNTLIGHLANVPMPEEEEQLEVGASIGIVIGKKATQVKADQALDYVAGLTIVNDVSIPHESVFRPAVKEKARDGFCPIGPWVMGLDHIPELGQLTIKVYVNGELMQHNHTSNLVRAIPDLLQDVTEFMTLYEDDVLMVGVPENPPLARDGDTVQIEIDPIGVLKNKVTK